MPKKTAETEHPYGAPGSLEHVRGVRAREIVRLAAKQVKDPSARYWLLADERGTFEKEARKYLEETADKARALGMANEKVNEEIAVMLALSAVEAFLKLSRKGRSERQHATKKSPAQLDREITAALSQEPSMTTAQVERYSSGRTWGWPADLAFKAATGRPLSRTPGRRSHAQKKTTALKDIEPGLRNVAQRSVNAENRFIDYAMEHGRLSRGQAATALAAFRKARVIKFDAVNGTFHVTHGQFLEPDVLRRAAGVEE
jgi:hypothetical protein